MTQVIRLLCRFFKGQSGMASIEFVFIFPVIFFTFLISLESGMMMIRSVMLERAVDLVMRELRLNNYENPTHALLRNEVCARTVLISDCATAIRINLHPVDTATWAMPTGPIECADRAEDLDDVTWDPLVGDELMIVKVCVAVDALFPTTGIALNLPLDSQGGYWLVTTSAFVNEPT